MSPVVGTAILLLLVLTSMSDSQPLDPKSSCDANYPPKPCKQTFGEGGWFQMGDGRCAKTFFNVPHLDFNDAEAACNKYRCGSNVGHLVSIHNIVELNQAVCIMYRVNPEKQFYWIGLRLTGNVNKVLIHTWTDNTPNTFTNWAPNQPDNYLCAEYCVEINPSGWGLWNDFVCSDKKPYMCAVTLS